MKLKTHQPGKRVLRKGERSLSHPSAQDTNTSPTRLATLTDGMCLGEIGFPPGRPRSDDVEANGLSHWWMLSSQMLHGLYRTRLDPWARVVWRVSGELEEKPIRFTDQCVAQEENQ